MLIEWLFTHVNLEILKTSDNIIYLWAGWFYLLKHLLKNKMIFCDSPEKVEQNLPGTFNPPML